MENGVVMLTSSLTPTFLGYFFLDTRSRIFPPPGIKYKDRGQGISSYKEALSHLTFSYDSCCKLHSRPNHLLVSTTCNALPLNKPSPP